jgi:multimeric flavodoxin WrbA
MGKSNTSLILDPFLEGAREAGAEVELIYLRKLKIKPCRGCFSCWLKTPGVCVHKDDVAMVMPKLGESDIWVFATPLYVDGMTGYFKMLLDRLIPGARPVIEIRDGHCRHPLRGDMKKGGKVVLIANCGFWELDNFEPLLVHMKAICKNMNREFAGALLRPHGEAMKPMLKMGIKLDDVFEAAKEAGRQIVRQGKISPQLQNIVSRELIPRDMYLRIANEGFKALSGRTA